MGGLTNKRILITRPEKQVDNLSKLVLEEGGEPILFSTLEIVPINNSPLNNSIFNNLNKYDGIIFISKNAVDKTFYSYLKSQTLVDKLKVFAIGMSTAKALKEKGIDHVVHAGDKADSETLLNNKYLSSEEIKDKTFLIVRGLGGREYLADSLRKRGAEVDYVEVYERRMPKYDKNYILNLWQNIKPNIVVVTSGEGLENLIKLTPETYKQTLLSIPLILMSNRLLEIAKSLGFISRTEIVDEKNDYGIMSSLLKMVGDI